MCEHSKEALREMADHLERDAIKMFGGVNGMSHQRVQSMLLTGIYLQLERLNENLEGCNGR